MVGVNGAANGSASYRPHPQVSFQATDIEPSSFFGRLRTLYAGVVLKTQLDQLKKQGSYCAFELKWHPVYDVRRLKGAMTRADGIPPSLFWESDVGKWIEGACYFLASEDGRASPHAAQFEASIQELVDMIEKAQQPDGYLNIYFTVVDPAGRFKNLRDMHEMYNAGHLLEASLAHYHLTGSRQFLDVMIKNVDCFARTFGEDPGMLHGYPGHPELELAVMRLYQTTKDPEHLAFAEYLLSSRGQPRQDQGGESFFIYEAKQRADEVVPHTLENIYSQTYNQSHAPLHEQDTILGHSVRALYLTTAAADLGGKFLTDAERLFMDAVDHKMYATGGLGTEPGIEGFSAVPYRLPQSTDEGGCYAETCASIAAMMTAERLLSHRLDGKVRDTMELCLYNAVLGGGSLDGKAFAYANKLATYGDETAIRNDWFEVCCCPPNLSRTLGMIGGYTWASKLSGNVIELDVYLFASAKRTISLPGGSATASMTSNMPWEGSAQLELKAPAGWSWKVNVPQPKYASNFTASQEGKPSTGFSTYTLDATDSLSVRFDMPVRLLASNPRTGQDNLTVTRGPIVYVAEAIDNPIEAKYPHFQGVAIKEDAVFRESTACIEGFDVVALSTDQVYAVEQPGEAYYESRPARMWRELKQELKYVPWFARANRGGNGHVRTAMLRCPA